MILSIDLSAGVFDDSAILLLYFPLTTQFLLSLGSLCFQVTGHLGLRLPSKVLSKVLIDLQFVEAWQVCLLLLQLLLNEVALCCFERGTTIDAVAETDLLIVSGRHNRCRCM